MKRFCAQMNDGGYINVIADRMEIVENMIYAHDRTELVAVVDISAVVSARISEEGTK